VRAEGYTSFKNKFTREKTLTASTYYGDHTSVPPNGTDAVCDLLRCLTSEKVLSARGMERLAALGVDAKALRDCLRAQCQPHPGEHIPGVITRMNSKRGRTQPAAKPRLTIKTERPATPLKRVPVHPMSEHRLEPPPPATRILQMFGPPTPPDQIVTAKRRPAARKRKTRAGRLKRA
jgi:hypothetical protein